MRRLSKATMLALAPSSLPKKYYKPIGYNIYDFQGLQQNQLQEFFLPKPVFFFNVLYNAYVNGVSSQTQLIINDVFHNMRIFLLPERKSCISKSQIHKIVFCGRINIFFSVYIISNCPFYQKCVFQIIKITWNSICGQFNVFRTCKRIR